MTTFAHIETGQALDPREAVSWDAYYDVSQPTLRDRWDITAVPDGTEHGATSDGNGGWVNPVKPTPPVVSAFVALDKTAFLAMYAANGGDLTATLDGWPKS